MKEMIYKPKYELEILHEETYKGFDYKVVSYGTHPCCYVAIRPELPIYKVDYEDERVTLLDCHYGVNFSDFRDFGDGKQWYIGWDYAHCEDYNGMYEHEIFKDFEHKKRKKWTTEEMKLECIYVIEQLIKEL